MNIDLPIANNPDEAMTPIATAAPATGSTEQADIDSTAHKATEAASRKAMSAARVAKYFKHRWPDRVAGDFSAGQHQPGRYGNVNQSTSLAAGPASNDADPIDAEAQNDEAVIEALHAAENEGWKAVASPAPSLLRRPSPPRRAGVRRSVHLR